MISVGDLVGDVVGGDVVGDLNGGCFLGGSSVGTPTSSVTICF
jgi:hypothetical protein